ncbi:MAG: hydrogenase iron-sulfur subunit [Candidatus Bathyarchaeota archaeon]|nr:hydrogenase iron-sulfur subunit [Candidatus Bathyarchaeota archaeon]
MSEKCFAAVEINQDLCSRCCVCHSICPFEAINYDRGKDCVEIDIQKCQVCGICASACPVAAIKIAYYDYEQLVNYVECTRKKTNSDTLVLMCRGNSPSTCEIEEILADQGLNIKNYVPLRLPCSGRVPTDFIFKTLSSGVKNIISIQCEDKFCRYKEGTKINARRFQLSKNVLKQLGFDENVLTVVKYSRKAVYKTEECVGCDKCVFICPYNAIKAEPFSTPRIVYEDCVGCGACALVCPHKAIEVKGYEFDNVLQRYGQAAKAMKARNGQPAVLVFSCQWSEFSALDNPNSALGGKNALVLEVPCFKGMDPVHVVNALECGFDGVMGVVCAAEDCKLSEGRDTAERNMVVLIDVLKKKGLLNRFELFELSPRCEGEFKSKFESFYQKIAAMPKLVMAKMEAR